MAQEPAEGNSRKSINELITRYQLHPEFRDVYVEGEWDCRLLRWLLHGSGITTAAIYTIDGVDIPATLLDKYKLAEGNKERVVALSYELAPHIQDSRQVTCLCDRDYDTILQIEHSNHLLLQTDYSCQEAYLLEPQLIIRLAAN